MQKKIEDSLGMIHPTEVLVNPNRSNIYFSSSRQGNRADELGNILDPLILDLRAKRLDFPLTIIYGSLEIISSMALAKWIAASGDENGQRLFDISASYGRTRGELAAVNRLPRAFHVHKGEVNFYFSELLHKF